MLLRSPTVIARHPLWAILLLALTVRLVWACLLQYLLDQHWHRQFLIEGDAVGYWELAHDIAAGNNFAIYSPPRYVLRMPGFPAILAVSIQLFGDSLFAVRLLLCVIGTGACWLVYVLARQFCDEATALTAAFLSTVSPALIGFSPLVLSETCFGVCILASLISAAALMKSAGANHDRPVHLHGLAFLTGLLISAGIYVRPSWLLWAPVTAAILFLPLGVQWNELKVVVQPTSSSNRNSRLRQQTVCAILILAGTVGPLIPWGLRNQRVTGHFVLTTLWMGPSLYDGLNPQATGDSDMIFFDRDNLLATMTEWEMNREYSRRAWAFVREHPGQSLRLAGIKFMRFWSPVPNADQFSSPGLQLLLALGTVPVLFLAVIGCWQCRYQWAMLVLTLGPILYFCALHLLFVSSLRYRLPAEYPVLVLSAVGWRAIWKRSQRSPGTE